MTKLKTLKDIIEEFKSDCIAKDFTESVLINTPLVGANAYYLDRLKQEAIAWIKEYRKEIEKHSHKEFNDNNLYLDCIQCRNKYVQIRWIVHFFNITEDDLK